MPLVVVDVEQVEPFVQPVLSNPVRRSWPEGMPADYERLARDASYLLGDSEGGAVRHRAYRHAHRQGVNDVIDDLLEPTGRQAEGSDPSVTVVCVTNRPQNLDTVLDHFRSQTWEHKRLMVVTNSEEFDRKLVDERVADTTGGEVVHTRSDLSLGACLNLALERASSRYVAKIDDDDVYGPSFLEDLMLAHRYADAGVVGKHSYHAYLADPGETILRFPDGDFCYTPYLAGGTLVIDRDRTGAVRFPHVSIGEDLGFIVSCLRRGISTFSADRYNYVQVRSAENTWTATEGTYLKSFERVGDGMATDGALI